MGELVQIDGIPYDWFNDGRDYVLHLAVDDASTRVLAGYFMPEECARGYARMMKLVLENYGIPEALYFRKRCIRINSQYFAALRQVHRHSLPE